SPPYDGFALALPEVDLNGTNAAIVSTCRHSGVANPKKVLVRSLMAPQVGDEARSGVDAMRSGGRSAHAAPAENLHDLFKMCAGYHFIMAASPGSGSTGGEERDFRSGWGAHRVES